MPAGFKLKKLAKDFAKTFDLWVEYSAHSPSRKNGMCSVFARQFSSCVAP
jgi:hypothetical protein|tara:strand:+ start:709 stop:858 length:150 start_codon:yes stop_codon:yes gene_type:complete